MRRNRTLGDIQISWLVAAPQRDLPEAVIERSQNGHNRNRSFAALAPDVSHADEIAIKKLITNGRSIAVARVRHA